MTETTILQKATLEPGALARAAEDWRDLQVRPALLQELAVKTLFLESELSSRELAARLKLSFRITDQIIDQLRKEHLCEIKGLVGSIYRVAVSGHGKERAVDLLARNGYVGPAPVSLASYSQHVLAQSIRRTTVNPVDTERIFRHLVLSDEALERIGTALVSGRTLFLYGPPGTGKTAIAEALAAAFGDSIWIPYAVEVDGQIITVFDPGIHQPLPVPADHEYDERWVLCRRPLVIVGGELTIEMLDLQMNPATKFYVAPPQMKAANGVLVVDDFGRQRVRPEELLNRWIVPLDRQMDLLALAGGKKFEIPFDVMVVFATNLELGQLGDDAFLRRMSSKIKMNYVSPEVFHRIFQQIAGEYGVEYDAASTDYLIDLLTQRYHQPLRPCYPRDILRQVAWAARYRGRVPCLDAASLEKACNSCFVSTESI